MVRLPADINVYSINEEGESTEDRFGQEHTKSYTIKYISIKKVYWPEGGVSAFNECYLEIGKRVACKDQEGNKWSIELTDQKVK